MEVFKEVELTEAEQRMRQERAGGNYGAGTKEIQARNYIARKENERKRKELFDDALADFRQGKIEDALVKFEDVKGMEPANYIGDSFERVSRIFLVTQYNIACCYSSLKSADAALEAIEDCMRCGFEDYQKARSLPVPLSSAGGARLQHVAASRAPRVCLLVRGLAPGPRWAAGRELCALPLAGCQQQRHTRHAWRTAASEVSYTALLTCGGTRVQIRTDKNLEFMRADERFKGVIEKYDEPILNENAINAIKSIFSFGKKK